MISASESSSPSGRAVVAATTMSTTKTGATRRVTHGGGDADDFKAMKEGGVADLANQSLSEDSNASSTSSADLSRGVGPRGEDELSSRSIHIQAKRFYLDVKQNPRGRFIKIAEVLPDGSKSRVALNLTSAREFRNHLTQFADFYESLQKGGTSARKGSSSSSSSEGEAGARNAAIKSAVIYGNGGVKVPVVGRRRYFLDLKENRRGKFLQVAEASSRAGMATRNRIVIPAQGMVEFRNNLSELLSEYWPSDDAALGDVDEGDISLAKEKDFPQPKSLRVHQGKVLYFDSGVNPRGSYLRISQVTTRFRTSILLPKESLIRVHSMLGDIIKEFDTPDKNNNNRSSVGKDDKRVGSPNGGNKTYNDNNNNNKSAKTSPPKVTASAAAVKVNPSKAAAASSVLAKVAEE